MRKIILTVVAMLAVATTTFAENDSNVTENTEKTANLEEAQYSINFNDDRIADFLHLDWDQKADMKSIHKEFSYNMEKALRSKSEKRQKMTKRAVYRDLANMRQVLGENQYSKYRMLLQVTLTNRGIEL